MRAEIADSVSLARSNAASVPVNEADTCFRIICPLLLGVGYAYAEILPQGTDAAGQKPDYTILPNDSNNTWFLEAKAWTVPLQDVHAQQAVNYANTQGKRWVVLSNGKEWRLYDNHINGTVQQMLAARAQLHDESFTSFVEAISKQSVTSGKLEQYVKNQRLFNVLADQLGKTDSDVVSAIRKVLRKQTGLESVSPADIVGYFQNGSAQHAAAIPVSNVAEEEDEMAPPADVEVLPEGEELCLSSVQGSDVTFRKPIGLRLPDGHVLTSAKWCQLIVQCAVYAISSGGLGNLPLFKSETSRQLLVARAGSAESSKLIVPETVEYMGQSYVVETSLSAIHSVQVCRRILSVVGIDPSQCILIVQHQSAQKH